MGEYSHKGKPDPLAMIGEEATEICKEAFKGYRWGFDDAYQGTNPAYALGSTPRKRMMAEIGDLLGALDYADACGALDLDIINAAKAARIKKMKDYGDYPS